MKYLFFLIVIIVSTFAYAQKVKERPEDFLQEYWESDDYPCSVLRDNGSRLIINPSIDESTGEIIGVIVFGPNMYKLVRIPMAHVDWDKEIAKKGKNLASKYLHGIPIKKEEDWLWQTWNNFRITLQFTVYREYNDNFHQQSIRFKNGKGILLWANPGGSDYINLDILKEAERFTLFKGNNDEKTECPLTDNFFRKVTKIISIEDGDTLKVEVDYGQGYAGIIMIRLDNINAPEIYGEQKKEGIIAKRALAQKLGEFKELQVAAKLVTSNDRWAADLVGITDNGKSVHINAWMLEEGYAEPFELLLVNRDSIFGVNERNPNQMYFRDKGTDWVTKQARDLWNKYYGKRRVAADD